MKYISCNKYSLIIPNSEIYNKDFSKELIVKANNTKSLMEYNKENFNNFFTNTIDYLSFIGCVIIEKKVWSDRERLKYYNTDFIHVGVIFQDYFTKHILVLDEILIRIRLGNEQWTSRSFEIWIFQWPRLINSFYIIPENLKIKYSEKPSLKRLRNIFVQRTRGSYNYQIYKKWFSKDNQNVLWNSILFIVSIFPIQISKLFLNLYLKKNKIRN